MAVTKIWTVSDSITRILGYVSNPDKTEYDDLRATLHYAGDDAKTEKAKFVSGINTTEKTAYEDMMAVKKCFGKTGGTLAFHAYQSFNPGEVTPELCHQIGLETARKLWGDKYQVIVATHLNKEHLHNHFVVNSVSFVNGKRLQNKFDTYYKLRDTSDRVCKKHELSVIKNPDGKTPRVIYLAEKAGQPTRYNLMREAIDYAVSCSVSYLSFSHNLREQGYIINHSENRKYDTIRIVGDEKATRLYQLGEQYESLEKIMDRVDENSLYETNPMPKRENPPLMSFEEIFGLNKFERRLRASYLHICYLFGLIPENNPYKPYSPELREEVRKLDIYIRRINLINDYHLDTMDDLHAFQQEMEGKMKLFIDERQKLRNKLRREDNPDEIAAIKSKISEKTGLIKFVRGNLKTAKEIEESSADVERKIEVEETFREQLRDGCITERPREIEHGGDAR